MKTKEITFKGINYEVGSGSYNLKKLNGKFWKTFTLRSGQIYAFSKLNLMVYRTH